ncbi:hypothetical protein IKF23_03065 [Candidatus Saccharibacteria bacterium]|nr:hypothetical protein [Candidatus Saccharibacteria bacterium]
MDQILFTWISVVVIFSIGCLAHFLYDIMKGPKALGLFAAINESTWEHIKIAITPTLLWGLVDGYLYGENPNYFTAKLASLLVITFFIPFVFYSYTRATKKPILPIDILTFAASIVLAQFTFYFIINQSAVPHWATYLSGIGCFMFFGAYMTLTLLPLKGPIFKDPITGKYGFRAHRDFFKSHQKSHSKSHTKTKNP